MGTFLFIIKVASSEFGLIHSEGKMSQTKTTFYCQMKVFADKSKGHGQIQLN